MKLEQHMRQRGTAPDIAGTLTGYRRSGWRRIKAATLMVALAAVSYGWTCGTADAQSWWPFSQPDAPRPKAPINRAPPVPIPTDSLPQPGFRPQSSGSPFCAQLEQRLVAESARGNQTRSQLPRIDDEMRQADRTARETQSQLDRGDCYDTFFFSKTLRRIPSCIQAANQLDSAKRRLSELSSQRQQLQTTTEHSYQDDIIRELARNNCGNQYVQEARKRDQSSGSIFGDTERDGDRDRDGNNMPSLPFATYRTVCVRLCDGFFFPVSYSTLPNHFPHDADQCHSRCAAPVELYYYQNPGSDIKQAMSVKSQTPYTSLKSAFRYTKEYVQGCSCKEAEYVPTAGEKKAEAPSAGGAAVLASGAPTQRPAAKAP